MSEKKRVLMICLGKNMHIMERKKNCLNLYMMVIYMMFIKLDDVYYVVVIFINYLLIFHIVGNICRSPIAEAVFENEMSKRGVKNQWEVESAAIMGYHTGKVPDHRALSTLKKNGITRYSHRARQVRL